MSKISLYKISVRRVSVLLMKETWKQCSVNPFSNLPSEIIDDVMEHLTHESISLTQPLLTSGSLTRLQFFNYNFLGERDLFLDIIRANCFKFLRCLCFYTIDESLTPLIETLVRSCPRLEEFHSCQIITLDAFQNCKELKVIEMCVINGKHHRYKLSHMNFSVLTSLRKLQKVCFENIMDSEIIANVLKHCPELVSIGCVDSLKGLQKCHANITRESEMGNTDVPEHFQLKRCFWGQYGYILQDMATDEGISYRSSFSEKVRIAVSLCPFVEKLIFCVSHPDSIESLKNLKLLQCLKITFLDCDSACMTNFIALLKIIGPQLKYISLDSRCPVPVDIVCDCCPRLEGFDILKFATATGYVQPHCNVSLKRLCIKCPDKNAILFLLSSCRGLVELFLSEAMCLDDSVVDQILKLNQAMCLDDSVVDQILKLNPLSRLRICHITRCSLSKRGYRKILEKTVSLERVQFAESRPEIAIVVENLIKELNLTNAIYEEFDRPFDFLSKKFFELNTF